MMAGSEAASQIEYSSKYRDAVYEFRQVVLPPVLARRVPRALLLEECRWRELGIQQGHGWEHCETRQPGATMVFRRRLEVGAAVAMEAEYALKATAKAQKAAEALAAEKAAAADEAGTEGGAAAGGKAIIRPRQRAPPRAGGWIDS